MLFCNDYRTSLIFEKNTKLFRIKEDEAYFQTLEADDILLKQEILKKIKLRREKTFILKNKINFIDVLEELTDNDKLYSYESTGNIFLK